MNNSDHQPTKTKRRRSSEAGFSLIELMVVIAIIAMLAAVVGFNVLGALEDAEVTTAKAEISAFKSALMSYRIVFKKLPTSEEGLKALIDNDKNRKFLDRINADKRIMLTSTILDGRFVLRICVLSFRTHAKNIDDCMQAIRAAI